jgi:hypothetical protein
LIDYRLATPADDADLRRLLREQAMPGWVSLTMTREPDYFAAAARPPGQEWSVIARDDATAGHTAVGMYHCRAHAVHWNGAPRTLGYLGGLRVTPAYRHRLRVLRDGYASITRLHAPPAGGFWFTSIAADNHAARRLLEAGLRGMPRYTPLDAYATLAISRRNARRHGLWQALPANADPPRAENTAQWQALCDFYNQHAARCQLAPVLTPEWARASGARFHGLRQGGALQACMALWDQRAYQQVRALAYRQPLHALRPLYNLYARCRRRVGLPAPGAALAQTFLAFFAASPRLDISARALVEDALAHCATPVLTLGLHAAHPWLEPLRQALRATAYQSWIYSVSFDDPPAADGRPAQPEAALL